MSSSLVEPGSEAPDENGTPVENAEVTETGGGHPAWNDVLGHIPPEFHPKIQPTLQSWDDNFKQVQEQFAPYKSFAESGVPAEDIQQALHIFGIINNDPKQFYEMTGKFLREQGILQDEEPVTQGQQEYQNEIQEEDDPRFKTYEDNMKIMAEALHGLYAEKNQAQEDRALDAELTRLREVHGDFDEQFVLNVAANNGGDLTKAIETYNGIVAKAVGTPRPGSGLPTPVAPGGAYPSQKVNPAELDSSGTKDLVVEFLKSRNG